MPKKEWTDEERKAFGAKMKASRAKKETVDKTVNIELPEHPEPDNAEEQDVSDLQRQILEMKENMDLMRAALLNQNQGVQMDRQGELVGEFEKYIIDPSNYPDPTPRLALEDRLKPLAFEYNYELNYEQQISSYQTKSGKNIKEPRFHVTLNRIVMDDAGQPTNKRYIARKMVFHEDPDAALVIARENGLEVNKADERLFLNEMRYIRVRDWLFDIFWAKPIQDKEKIKDEVIGGTIVQVFTKNSEQPGDIAFDKLTTKIRT